MNRYGNIKALNNLNLLVSLGIISITVIDWIVLYEYYLDERKSNGKMQSYCNTAENYKVNETTIRRIASWMESY